MDELWLDPREIVWKICPADDLHGIKGGDWDIKRRFPFCETAKYLSIKDRYIHGKPWLETDLFTRVYKRRLSQDGRIGAYHSLVDLAANYERRYDGLFRRLEKHGFTIDNGRGKNYSLPTLMIGRSGEVFLGNQGNHRLAMAKVLGLERFAGRVVCQYKNLIE